MPQAHHVYRSWLADEGEALAAALEGDPTTPVPGCPGWSITGLVAHVGSFHRWTADLLRDVSPQPRPLYALRPDPDAPLAQWYRASLELLLRAVDTTDPDAAMWTVTLDRRAGAWCRRQAHDLAVHRWDVQHARGHAQPVRPERAADFIDELFEESLPYILPIFGRPVPDRSLALRSLDGSYTRRIDGSAGRPHLSHDQIPADATVIGTPSDLLLTLWRRTDAPAVTGDPTALTAWQQAVDGPGG
jgi:uncharacterized protein (TIGR03083 family)